MKLKLILYTLAAVVFTSCSTAYKASQTPDDVYYSPTNEIADNNKEEKNDRRDRYEEYTSAEDRYLRMKSRNRDRWSTIDDYDYWYSPNYCANNYVSYNYNHWRNNTGITYSYGNRCACACNSAFSSSIFFPGYYNPYYSYYPGYMIKFPGNLSPNVNRPNLGSYSNGSYNNTNSTNTFKKVFGSGNYNNSNRNSGSSETYKSSDRTYRPSSGSSSSGSSSSGGSGRSGGGVSRPVRN
jgi:uncharacterized membrane protein YgcG